MKIDRSILQANDQNIGDFGDPDKIESSINHLANVIDANDNDATALKTDNTANKSNISTLQGDVSSLKTDNTSNKTRLTALENDNTSNKNRIGTLETDNTSNKSRITTNEGNIAYTGAQLTELLRNNQKANEVVAARVKADGTTFPLLGDRLNDVDVQLAEIVYVCRYNLKTDGITDNLVNWNSLMEMITEGKKVIFPPGVYKMVGEMVINKPCHVVGYGAKLLFDTNSDHQGVRITDPDALLEGFEVEGPQSLFNNMTQIGISADGSVNTYLKNVQIKNCFVHKWANGINFEFIEKFGISNNKVEDCYYTGIRGKSVNNGHILRNHVDHINADGIIGSNAYGIAVTKSNGTDLTNPHSRNVFVSENIVSNIKTWEGLDTHGGDNIHFINNTVLDCATGIAVVSYDIEGQKRGASNCIVKGNTILNQSLPSNEVMYGLVIEGDAIESLAKDNIANENIIDGYGDSDNSIGCAVYIKESEGTQFKHNIVKNSGNIGIGLFGANGNIQVDGNNIDDVLTGSKYGIYVQKGSQPTANTGFIRDNVIIIKSAGGTGVFGYDSNTGLHFKNNEITADTKYNAGTVPNQKFLGRIEPFILLDYVWDPPSIVAGSSASQAISIPGMAGTMKAYISPDRHLNGLILSYQVATDQITLYLHNQGGVAIDLASTKFRIRIEQ